MILVLEAHDYAPELNMVHLFSNSGGCQDTLKAPGCRDVAEVRKMIFQRSKPGHYVTINVVYDPPFDSLNRHYSGYVPDLPTAILFYKQLRNKHRGSGGALLLNGSVLPDPSIKFTKAVQVS